MKQKQRSIHKSKWNEIIVFENNEVKIFKLNDTGRLEIPFNREKSRKISILFDKLVSSSSNNTIKQETNEIVDIKSKLNSESLLYLLNQSINPEDEDLIDSFLITDLSLTLK